ncbi:sodium/potassium-transporting ATPase subunit beta-2-like [Schistocerca piceifrons]|uniref:sodium/potassium-transporting ATPase subunit beta-2-like n=1 Tax=Schistocerca piceifrons TaxID=274613 RepID=UPI001F5E5EF7|nr:sodium/potassium-transporting ATPase subunit beta-2-like [Schistocerca piceifrons]
MSYRVARPNRLRGRASPAAFSRQERPRLYMSQRCCSTQPSGNSSALRAPPDDTLWVSCEGYHPSDVEHVGNISYYPQPGFKAVYFPYKESSNYLSPIVAVKFSEPMKDLLITVKCRAWAKNIGTFTTETGRTDYQLMIGQMPRPKQ